MIRGIKSYNDEKSEDFGGWHKAECVILSIQHSDISAVLEGQARPVEETDQTATNEDTETTRLHSC